MERVVSTDALSQARGLVVEFKNDEPVFDIDFFDVGYTNEMESAFILLGCSVRRRGTLLTVDCTSGKAQKRVPA